MSGVALGDNPGEELEREKRPLFFLVDSEDAVAGELGSLSAAYRSAPRG